MVRAFKTLKILDTSITEWYVLGVFLKPRVREPWDKLIHEDADNYFILVDFFILTHKTVYSQISFILNSVNDNVTSCST